MYRDLEICEVNFPAHLMAKLPNASHCYLKTTRTSQGDPRFVSIAIVPETQAEMQQETEQTRVHR